MQLFMPSYFLNLLLLCTSIDCPILWFLVILGLCDEAVNLGEESQRPQLRKQLEILGLDSDND